MAASVMTQSANMVNAEGVRPSLPVQRYIRSENYVCTGENRVSHAVALRSANKQSLPLEKGSVKGFQESTMPITTSSQSLLASCPSFMSVFGDGVDTCHSKDNDAATANAPARPAHIAKRPLYNTNYSSPLFRRDSVSTFESTESSPTTTISTLDSSITEPSPSSSPESPRSLSPLSSFRSVKASATSMEGGEHDSNPFASVSNLNRADSPNKKMRNTKNLSVNTSASSRQAPQLPRLSLSSMSNTGTGRAFSAPATPSFIVPPKPPRKRLSNLGLSIETPDPGAPSQTSQNGLGTAPPTPSEPQPRTFRFLQSASSLQAISSPTVAPKGGMKLPPFGKTSIASRLGKGRPLLGLSHSYEAATPSPITVQTLEHVQEENDYELPLSREAKSPAYPEGPVCIYDPHVYLYLEPNDTEASQFDVVLNVAREVVNPFKVPMEKAAGSKTEDAAVQASFESSNIHLLDWGSKSEPRTAISEKSFRSAFETLPEEVVAIPSSPESLKAPEYIHIPWDHNTNVVDDLLRLCELIDNRVQHGKRVLIHCQCGVSRSASLVVAYGLYKNPQLTVQEAYNAVKDRSRWIGPNMNLIYQLSEFKSKLPRTFTAGSSNWHSSRNIGSGRSNPKATFSVDSKLAASPSSVQSVQTEPTSAPFQKDPEPTPTRANSFSPPGSAQVVETSAIGDISPGPSSAPPDMQWTPSEQVPDSNHEQKYRTRDDLIPSSLFPMQTIDINPPSQLRTSMSAPNIVDFDTTDLLSKAEASQNKMHIDIVAQKSVAFSELDTSTTTNAVLEQTSLSPLKLRGPPFDNPEPTQASQLGFMDIDSAQPTRSLSSLAKPADIEIAFQRGANAISLPATKAIETVIRLPPSFTSDDLKTVKTAPEAPPVPPSPTLPAGFSSLSARRARSSLALRQIPTKPLRPQLSLISLNNPALDDIPPTPSLLSPRAAEFTASPFYRTAAGDLAVSSFLGQALLSPRAVEEDPRSPAMRGEAPITRSIFDVLR